MLSRVAENIYWLSRYLERAENTVRLVNTYTHLLLDLPAVDDHQSWIPLVIINGQDKVFSKVHTSACERSVNQFLLAEEENASSLINGFKAIQYNLRSCRDIVPKTSYEAINSLCRLYISGVPHSISSTSQRSAFLRQIEDRLLAVSGGVNSNMSHDLAYRFMRMGCYLERADMTSRIIDVQSSRHSFADAEDILMQQQRWGAVLKTLSAAQMYRQHVHRPINGPDVLTYLLNDSELPRSYRFCLSHLDGCLDHLQNDSKVRHSIAQLTKSLDSANADELAHNPGKLHHFLDSLQLGMMGVSSAIASTYFPPAQDR